MMMGSIMHTNTVTTNYEYDAPGRSHAQKLPSALVVVTIAPATVAAPRSSSQEIIHTYRAHSFRFTENRM